MTTKFMQAYLSAAVSYAEDALPAVSNATADFKTLLWFCRQYRTLGIGILFLFADGPSLQKYLWKSGRAYLHLLPRLVEDAKVTSRGKPFFDAVAALDFDGARAIAAASRGTRSHLEFDEDFLFPHFLMQRFLLGADDGRDQGLLDQWDKVLEGSPDPRLDVCRALFSRDNDAFDDAMTRYLEHVEDTYARLADAEALGDDELSTQGKMSVEGLALIVLAERLGMATRPDYLLVPSLARPRAPLQLAPDAWTRVTD